MLAITDAMQAKGREKLVELAGARWRTTLRAGIDHAETAIRPGSTEKLPTHRIHA